MKVSPANKFLIVIYGAIMLLKPASLQKNMCYIATTLGLSDKIFSKFPQILLLFYSNFQINC